MRNVRVVTYNVHRCVGLSGPPSPGRIAEVVAACEPDIVALQELDVGRARTGGIDQADAIAAELGMEMHFHPALCVMEELYGDAILTPGPSRLVKAGALPGLAARPGLEPRGALWAEIKVGGMTLQIVNTHLGLLAAEQVIQVETLLSEDWLSDSDGGNPVVLLGDFNAMPRSRAYRRLAGRFADAQCAVAEPSPRPTFPSLMPMLRIDHVFLGGSLDVAATEVVRTPLTRRASDHLPLVADLRLPPAVHGDGGQEGVSWP